MKRTSTRMLCLLLALSTGQAIAQTVSTVTTAMPFTNNIGIAVGRLDTLYVSSIGSLSIYKIPPGGTPVLLAGNGTFGSTDGSGTAASMQYVYDMETDASGNIYFVQYPDGQVRKVTPDGTVSTITTVAGNGISIAIGKNDTLYTYSYSSGAFRRILPDSTVEDIATLPPMGFDLDYVSHDTFYLAGFERHQVYRINAAGTFTTLAGNGLASTVDGTGTSASFNYPISLVRDGHGDIYVSEYQGNTIRKIAAGAVVTTFAGSGSTGSADGTGTAATFANPGGIALSKPTGNLYLAELSSTNIRIISGAVALPLSWISIGAFLNQRQQASLQWKVNEKSVLHFDVLKSTDGTRFFPIANISSQGDGTQQYSYTEPLTLSGKAYYRIRQTDISGAVSLSGTMQLSSGDKADRTVKVYPTLIKDGFTISSEVAQNASVFDVQGHILQQITLSGDGSHYYVDASQWQPGTYYVQTENGSTQALVKP